MFYLKIFFFQLFFFSSILIKSFSNNLTTIIHVCIECQYYSFQIRFVGISLVLLVYNSANGYSYAHFASSLHCYFIPFSADVLPSKNPVYAAIGSPSNSLLKFPFSVVCVYAYVYNLSTLTTVYIYLSECVCCIQIAVGWHVCTQSTRRDCCVISLLAEFECFYSALLFFVCFVMICFIFVHLCTGQWGLTRLLYGFHLSSQLCLVAAQRCA